MTPKGRVALSTTSTYPESTAAAFEIAARLGYDGVEVMVWTDPVSQDVDALRRLSDYHGVPVLSVHSPCLLVTQRVWGTDPWAKLTRARQAAERLGASTVVVHPPFRWQSTYAQEFVAGIARMADETDVRFAVENMYPWRAAGREFQAYLPDWDPTPFNYDHVTLDLSHTAVSGQDALAAVSELGDRLAHLHLADGTGSNRDEHLVPGRGNEPTAEVLELLATRGFEGTIVLEVSTRKAANRAEREADLAESLAYARLHFAAPPAGAEPAAAPAAGRGGAVPIDLRRGRPRLVPPGAQVGDPAGGRPAGVPNDGPAPASPAPDDVDATPKGPAARAREALAAAWAAAEFGSPEPAADPSPGTTSAPRRPLGPSASLIALAADRRRARRGEPEDTAAELYGSPSDLHRP